jgi:phosphoribosylformimino-5-aminoimidazole carboxamide ribotide isomerase
MIRPESHFARTQGEPMQVIPVLDLKDGAVVHARLGQRDQYRPIETPLALTSEPVDVARGLLSLHPFKTIYIADLDAIEGKGDNIAALRQLRVAFSQLAFWVDNGVADLASAQNWLDAALGHLVVGSESQKDGELVGHLAHDDRIILSLDYRGEAFLGPAQLLRNADAWPRRVIVMTLARVGSHCGPDMDRLLAIRARVRNKEIYAAGGVRNASDLSALAAAGIAGALVASSLHNGALAGTQIARLQGSTLA